MLSFSESNVILNPILEEFSELDNMNPNAPHHNPHQKSSQVKGAKSKTGKREISEPDEFLSGWKAEKSTTNRIQVKLIPSDSTKRLRRSRPATADPRVPKNSNKAYFTPHSHQRPKFKKKYRKRPKSAFIGAQKKMGQGRHRRGKTLDEMISQHQRIEDLREKSYKDRDQGNLGSSNSYEDYGEFNASELNKTVPKPLKNSALQGDGSNFFQKLKNQKIDSKSFKTIKMIKRNRDYENAEFDSDSSIHILNLGQNYRSKGARGQKYQELFRKPSKEAFRALEAYNYQSHDSMSSEMWSLMKNPVIQKPRIISPNYQFKRFKQRPMSSNAASGKRQGLHKGSNAAALSIINDTLNLDPKASKAARAVPMVFDIVKPLSNRIDQPNLVLEAEKNDMKVKRFLDNIKLMQRTLAKPDVQAHQKQAQKSTRRPKRSKYQSDAIFQNLKKKQRPRTSGGQRSKARRLGNPKIFSLKYRKRQESENLHKKNLDEMNKFEKRRYRIEQNRTGNYLFRSRIKTGRLERRTEVRCKNGKNVANFFLGKPSEKRIHSNKRFNFRSPNFTIKKNRFGTSPFGFEVNCTESAEAVLGQTRQFAGALRSSCGARIGLKKSNQV